jgi:alpha-N-arabinofuranosidase
VSLVNIDPQQDAKVTIQLDGVSGKTADGRIVTAPTLQTHNTFDAPDTVAAKPFGGAKVEGGKLQVNLPAKSVVTVSLR